MTPIGRLADEPYRLTDALDATTHVAEYSFLADAGDLVTVTASPLSSADLFLTLHADDAVGMSPGLQVAFGDDASASTRDPAINAVVPASGTYRITVAARAEFGLAPVASQFRLTASRQASSFTVPAGASGRAGGHAFTIAQSGVLDVTFGSAQWQPTAQPQLFDAAGTVIASAGLPDGSGRARLSQYVTPGDYVISHAMPLARDTAVSMRFAGVSALQSPWGPQAAGEDPSFLVLADVDGDTLEDLVVANPTRQRGSDVISVMLGRPQGRFADRQEFEVPGGVEAGLQVRDINGDNMPDLVALGTDDGGAGSVGTVSVLFGRRDGTFSPAIATPLDGRPKAAAIADFDGDGFLDAAVATGGIVSVLRGNRDGRFVADRTYDSGLDSIGSLLVAAMDRDGRADLVMVGRRAAGHALAVVRGEHHGAFTSTPALLLDFRAGMTIAPDLDQDGVSDVVVVNETAGTVEVFLGMGDGSVAARRTLIVGATPTAVAAGRVDDDDLMDLVVTCSTARGVYLLPGSGGGAFRQPRVVGGGPRPGVVAIADVDDDGRTDLVYRDLGLDSVRFIIQGPGGTFDEKSSQSVDRGPAGIMTGDFNGDGRPDVASINTVAGTLSVLLGKGDGGFTMQRSYPVGRSPQSGAVADINRDGRLDVAVANEGDNSITVMLGLGDGRLGDAFVIKDVLRPSAVALADLDGDRRIDLIVAQRTGEDQGVISVRRGLGNGSFDIAPRSFAVSTSPVGIVLAKVDNNESTDIFVLGERDSSGFPATLRLLLANADGGFASERFLWDITSPVTLDAADVDGDGILDIVTGSLIMTSEAPDNNSQYRVQISLGRGDGTFMEPQSLQAGRRYFPRRVRASDVSGDGRLDIVSMSIDPDRDSGGMLTVYVQLEDGTFSLGADFYPPFNKPLDFITTDLNDDGRVDLVTANFADDALSTFLGAGSGWQTVPQYVTQIGFTEWNPSAAVPADVNGDGLLDIVLATRIGFGSSDSEASGNRGEVLQGQPDGSFAPGPAPPLASWDAEKGDKYFIPAAADLDDDGIVDLVTADVSYSRDFFGFDQVPGSTVTVHFGAGRGTFNAPLSVAVGQQPAALAIADLDRDGLQDILTANAEDDTVSILYGLDGRRFERQQVIHVGAHPTQLKIYDVDNDGCLDVVAGNRGRENSGRSVSISRGRPDRSFHPAEFTPVRGGEFFSIDVANLDGDTYGDLAVTSLATSSVSVFPGTSGGQFVSGREFFVGQDPRDVHLEDFDRDGQIDIVTANYLDGTLSVLRGRGKGTFQEQLIIPVSATARGVIAVVDGGVEPDGRPRLIAVNHDGSYIVTVPGGTGGALSPTLHQAVLLKFIFNPADSLAFGSLQKAIPLDADGSGTLDVLSLDRQGAITVRTISGAPGMALPQSSSGTFAGRGVDACALPGAGGRDRAAVIDRNGATVFIVTVNATGAPVISQILSAREPSTPSEPSPTLSRITAADLNRDGWADLLVSNPGAAAIDILIARSDGSFDDTAWERLPAGAGVSQVLIDDINDDNIPDLIAANQISGTLTVRYGIDRTWRPGEFTPAEGFTADLRFSLLASPHHYMVDPLSGSNTRAGMFRISAIAVCDLDGDGHRDIVTANGNSRTMTVVSGSPAGGLRQPRVVIPTTASEVFLISDIASGDFDGDGRDDLALLDVSHERLLVYASRKTPVLSGTPQVVPLTHTMPRSIEAVDRDGPGNRGDGILDLLIGNEYGDVLTLQGVGDGTFKTYVRADQSVALLAADVDGDGKDEFLYGSKGLDRIWVDGAASQQSFEADQKKGVLGPSAVATVTEMVDGRGFKNLVVANGGANQILVFRSDATARAAGLFLPDPQTFYVGTNPSAVVVADVDKDGLADVVVSNEGSNDVSVMLGVLDGTGRWTLKSGPRLKSGGSSPAGITVDDFAGNDGVPDIAVTNRGSNSLAILQGIAGGFFNDTSPTLLPTISSPGPIVPLPSPGGQPPGIAVGSSLLNQVQTFGSSGSGYRATGTYSGGGASLATTTFRGSTYLAAGNSATGGVSIFLSGPSSLRFFTEAKDRLPGLTSLAFDSAGRLFGVSPTSRGALAMFGFNASPEAGATGSTLTGLLQTMQAFTIRVVFAPLTAAGVGLVAAIVTSEGVALTDPVEQATPNDVGDRTSADGGGDDAPKAGKNPQDDAEEAEASPEDSDEAGEEEAESNPLLDFILDAKNLLRERNRRLIRSFLDQEADGPGEGGQQTAPPAEEPAPAAGAEPQRGANAADSGSDALASPQRPAKRGDAEARLDVTAQAPAAVDFRAIDLLPMGIALIPPSWGGPAPRSAMRRVMSAFARLSRWRSLGK